MRALLFGVLTLATLAGCGEDTIPLSEYADRANAICRDNNTRGRAELDRFRKRLEADGELDNAEMNEVNRKVLEILEPGTERLEALPLPDEKSDTAEEWERASREANEAFADIIDAAEEGDAEQVREAKERNEERLHTTHELAADLGLDDCDGS